MVAILLGSAGKIPTNQDNVPVITIPDKRPSDPVVLLDTAIVSSQETGGEGGNMEFPPAGIPVSTGSSWGSSIADNSMNWNTAYGWDDHSIQGYPKVVGHVLQIPVGSSAQVVISPIGSLSDIGVIIQPKGNGPIGFTSNDYAYFGGSIIYLNSAYIEYAPDISGTGKCEFFTTSQLSLLIRAGNRVNVKAGDLELYAGDSTNDYGGDVFIGAGVGSGASNLGDIYFAKILGITTYPSLKVKAAETNVVYYDTSTGKISYGVPPTSGYPPPEDTTINRTNGLISTIVKTSKTITISRDIDNLISSINDGTYQKDIIRTNGVITGIDVTIL